MIDLNFKTYLTRMLPWYKRKPNRLNLFYWPFAILQELFDWMKTWRTGVYYRINISGQVLSMQSLLNTNVAGANGLILVKSFDDLGIWVQLRTEPGEDYRAKASLLVEDLDNETVSLEGERIKDDTIDFYVYVPSTVNIYEVEKWVNNYKIAGKRYVIIQS